MSKKKVLKVLLGQPPRLKDADDGLKETLYLLRHPSNMRHLLLSIIQYLNGKQKKN
jgi:hypothetical protein